MTRTPRLDGNVTISVYCKSGKNYFDRDTVPNPYGTYGNTLTFWATAGTNELITVPLEQIEKIVFNLGDDTQNKLSA